MFDKILVAVDLDLEGARTVLDRGLTLAGTSGELWVLHVVEPQYVQYSIDPTFTGSMTRAMEEDAVNAARTRVAEICEPSGVSEDHQLVMLGHPAERVHQVAEELGVDTIIIGSHARRGLRRLLGSTANAVLHGAPVNVMTIRMNGEKK